MHQKTCVFTQNLLFATPYCSVVVPERAVSREDTNTRQELRQHSLGRQGPGRGAQHLPNQ